MNIINEPFVQAMYIMNYSTEGGDKMLTPMLITFRESLEILLVIAPLLVFLRKVERTELSKYIYTGYISGTIVSVIIGCFLFASAKSLEGYAANIFEGSMMLFLAGLLLYSIGWVGKTKKNITLDKDKNYDMKLTGVSLFLMSFITVFRECLEIVLFLLPGFNKNPFNIGTGIVIGVSMSFILIFMFYKTTLKLNINIIFSFLTLMLIFIGASMFGGALAEFIPSMSKSIKVAGEMIYAIPILYLFSKRELKAYMKKNLRK